MSILKRYQDTIDFVYTGHTHHSLVFNADVPIIVNPAISPIFGDFPGFRYYLPHTWHDWAYTFDNDTWYMMSDFGTDYGLPEIDIPALADKIAESDELTLTYLKNSFKVKAEFPDEITKTDVWMMATGIKGFHNSKLIYCQMNFIVKSDFDECMKKEDVDDSDLANWITLPAMIFIAALAF